MILLPLEQDLQGIQRVTDHRYKTGLFDPPWWESGGGKCKRGADRHYPLMKTKDICALPIGELFQPNAHLYLWATNNHLPDALEVMKAWGFRYVTMVTWGKVVIEPAAVQVVKTQTGLGQYFRGSTEHLLFGVRGKVPYRTTPEGKRAQGKTLYLAPRREEHSVKPEIFRLTIERVSAGPYIEGFARARVPGWDAWAPKTNHAGDALEGSVTLRGAERLLLELERRR